MAAAALQKETGGEATPPDKSYVSLEDNSKVSPRDIYMRLCACRDFEIKLQWERAVFLTAFLIACYAGYGSFLLSVHQHGAGAGNFSSLVINGIFITLTFVGVVLSLLWILMAKGSKAWYEHYEQAIAAFAKDKATGEVPECMLAHRWYDMPDIKRSAMNNCMFNFSGGAYSVSKIVIAIGICSLVIWSALFILHTIVAFFGPVGVWKFVGGELKNWCVWGKILAIGLISGAFWYALKQLTTLLTSGCLEKVKVFLPEQESDLKKESWSSSEGDVKEWIKKQSQKARRYVLIVKGEVTTYDPSEDGIKEKGATDCFKNDVKALKIRDGLFSL